MAIKIISKNHIQADLRGYDAQGVKRRIREAFPRSKAGREQAAAFIIQHKQKPKFEEETLGLRTMHQAVESYTQRTNFLARRPDSQAKEKRKLQMFLNWCDNNGIAYVTQFNKDIAESYGAHCIKTYKRKGIEHRIGLAHRVIKSELNRDSPSITRNPFRDVKKTGYNPRKEIKHLTREQMAQMITIMNDRELAIINVLFETAMRSEEFQKLRWEQVKEKYIDISSSEEFTVKTGESGTIPISDNVRAGLEYLREYTGTEKYVIFGHRPANRTFLYNMISRVEKRLKKENPNFPHIHPHLFRSSLAMYLIDLGEDLHKVQRFLRHKSLKTTETHYGRPYLRHLDSSLSKLNSGHNVSTINKRLIVAIKQESPNPI